VGRYAVLGATSWGVTLAWLIARNGHDVELLCRTTQEAASVNSLRGLSRLPEVRLPANVRAVSSGWPAAVEALIIAVPTQSLETTISALTAPRDVPVVCASKGITRSTLLRPSEVIAAAGWNSSLVSVISGPNLAHEVGKGLPAAAVVASPSISQSQSWQSAISGGAFRVYTSHDVVGVEVAGALKNVVAIAAGAAAQLGFGANAVATVLTRGLAEVTRLGVALGADPLTFQGLAGVGDLAATCFSPLSRNRRFGELLAAGKTADEASSLLGEVAEGAATASAAIALARGVGIELPIAEEVAAVVAGERSVQEAMDRLLQRPPRAESAARP
jgi:glycerol-3-phosphate dehydrogenase (NAD(P)+)